MNPFYLYAIALNLLSLPINTCAQVTAISSNPLHTLSLLGSSTECRPFIQLRYTCPYGISSFSDLGIRHNQPLSRGYLLSSFNALGIKGCRLYNFELGYVLQISPDFQAGLILFADLTPKYLLGYSRFRLGSSFYSSVNYDDRVICNVYFNNWTDLLQSEKYSGRAMIFSVSSKVVTNNDVNIIAGILYEKGRMPLLRLGVSIMEDSSHTIMTGMQTGPIGFWLGYKFSAIKLNFIFSIQTSSIFGYEPGSSLKYLLN